MGILTIKSYAKVNLTLSIIKKLPSGYHNIESLMQRINLHDNLSFEKLQEQILIKSNNPSLETEDNLVYKATNLLKQNFKVKDGVCITIEKNIPLSSGLGGGSSNAATTLLALNRIWKLRLKEKELIKFAIKIGTDVPFFIVAYTALVSGVGDKIKKIERYPKLNYVLINPGYKISTENAYKVFDKLNVKSSKRESSKAVRFLIKGDIKNFAGNLFNDFEEVIFKKYKDLKEIKLNLIKEGALNAILSGSGPTIVGVFDSIYEAREAYFKLKNDYPFVFFTKTI